MSEDRNVQSGERRLERIRAERGMPVRRAPIAAGALYLLMTVLSNRVFDAAEARATRGLRRVET